MCASQFIQVPVSFFFFTKTLCFVPPPPVTSSVHLFFLLSLPVPPAPFPLSFVSLRLPTYHWPHNFLCYSYKSPPQHSFPLSCLLLLLGVYSSTWLSSGAETILNRLAQCLHCLLSSPPSRRASYTVQKRTFFRFGICSKKPQYFTNSFFRPNFIIIMIRWIFKLMYCKFTYLHWFSWQEFAAKIVLLLPVVWILRPNHHKVSLA